MKFETDAYVAKEAGKQRYIVNICILNRAESLFPNQIGEIDSRHKATK